MAVHDPFVEHAPGVTLTPSLEDTIRGADAVVDLCRPPPVQRYLMLFRVKTLTGKKHPVIVDGRNIIDPDTYIQLGFIYKGIGAGKNGHAIRE